MPVAPGDAAARTYARRAAVAPEAALGPAIPAKSTQNTTGTVTTTATAVEPVTAVPITSRTLPTTPSRR